VLLVLKMEMFLCERSAVTARERMRARLRRRLLLQHLHQHLHL